MTHLQVVKHVQKEGRYFRHGFKSPTGKRVGSYAVEFNGKIYYSDDTGDLVEKICKETKIID